MDSGYEALAIAILNRAVADYRLIAEELTEYMTASKLQYIERQLWELEQFFISDYGNILSRGMGKEIVRRLRQERKDL